jgi:hypothetical protein
MGYRNIAIIAGFDETRLEAGFNLLTPFARHGRVPDVTERRRLVQLSDSTLDITDATERAFSGISFQARVDLIWIMADGASDAFLYAHWRLGAIARLLTYGEAEQFVWSRVAGSAEAWEEQAFKEGGVVDCASEQPPTRSSPQTPKIGQRWLAPDAMRWATIAERYWRSRGGAVSPGNQRQI